MAETTSFRYSGNTKQARNLKGMAANQLTILKNAMSFRGLKQGMRRLFLDDGSVIQCQSVFGTNIVQVFSPVQVIELEKPIEKIPEFGQGLFVFFLRHDSVNLQYLFNPRSFMNGGNAFREITIESEKMPFSSWSSDPGFETYHYHAVSSVDVSSPDLIWVGTHRHQYWPDYWRFDDYPPGDGDKGYAYSVYNPGKAPEMKIHFSIYDGIGSTLYTDFLPIRDETGVGNDHFQMLKASGGTYKIWDTLYEYIETTGTFDIISGPNETAYGSWANWRVALHDRLFRPNDYPDPGDPFVYPTSYYVGWSDEVDLDYGTCIFNPYKKDWQHALMRSSRGEESQWDHSKMLAYYIDLETEEYSEIIETEVSDSPPWGDAKWYSGPNGIGTLFPVPAKIIHTKTYEGSYINPPQNYNHQFLDYTPNIGNVTFTLPPTVDDYHVARFHFARMGDYLLLVKIYMEPDWVAEDIGTPNFGIFLKKIEGIDTFEWRDVTERIKQNFLSSIGFSLLENEYRLMLVYSEKGG